MRKHYLLICGLLILATLAAGLALYPHLPEKVPSHFDIHGRINGYTSRTLAVTLMPAIMIGVMLLFAVLPAISPRHFEIDPFRSTYNYLVTVIMASMAYFHGIMLWAALARSVPINRAFLGGICMLWVLMGNVIGKVRRNFFVGVRTPWTLANEQVWYATHRFAARLWVWSGLACLLLAFVVPQPIVILAILLTAALVPVIYSFVYYKRLERHETQG